MEVMTISVFNLAWLIFCVNSSINGWLIHSGFAKSFPLVLQARTVGSLLLLIPCILYFEPDYFFVQSSKYAITVAISLLLLMAAWIFNTAKRRTVDDTLNYAYLLNGPNGWSFVIPEILSWMIYLLPFEFLVRGLVFPKLLDKFNPEVAVFICCSVYALSHFEQGKREIVSAFVFGLLLCSITWFTFNFWCAFIAHLGLALTNSYIVSRKSQLTLLKN